MPQYKVQVQGRTLYYASLKAARAFCNEVYQELHIFVSIIEVQPN